jgi:hypothetical protein
MCLYPKLIHNPKYKPNKKNGGRVPPITDPRVIYVPIGCGNCIECRKQKARNWQIRLLEDIKTNKTGKFITLTFSDESIAQLTQDETVKGYTLDNQIATKAVRLFLERWRKTHGTSLRHWLVTELGHNGTNNIHLHGIVWPTEYNQIHEIQKHWQYGYVHLGKPIYIKDKIIDYENWVNETTIAYIIKYVTKAEEKYKTYKSIILTSPGIGKNYTNNSDSNKNKFKPINTNETYNTTTGHKIALPIYYRNKIYTDEEREILWLQKLDTEKRYILGIEINANDVEHYLEVLKHAKEKNQKLGYGTDKVNWDQKKYEQQIREQMQNTRIAKGKKKIASGGRGGLPGPPS